MSHYPRSTLTCATVDYISARMGHGNAKTYPHSSRLERFLVYGVLIPTVLLVIWALLAPVFLLLAFVLSLQLTVLWLKVAASLFAWLLVALAPLAMKRELLEGTIFALAVVLLVVSFATLAFPFIQLETAWALSITAFGLLLVLQSKRCFEVARQPSKRRLGLAYGILGALLSVGCLIIAVLSLYTPTNPLMQLPISLFFGAYYALTVRYTQQIVTRTTGEAR